MDYIAEDKELPGKTPGLDWVVDPIKLPGVDDDDVAMEPPPNIEIMDDLKSTKTETEPVLIEQSQREGIPMSETVPAVVPESGIR